MHLDDEAKANKELADLIRVAIRSAQEAGDQALADTLLSILTLVQGPGDNLKKHYDVDFRVENCK